jgi:CelD/BcsL family acetyltransferase involved in cellulose biosynthesis
MSQHTEIKIIKNWLDFKELKSSWGELLESSDANSLFLTWDWINCWQQTSATENHPYIVLIIKNNNIIGIAPFYIQKYCLLKYISYKALRFIGDQNIGSEYANFIVSPIDSSAIKQQLWQILSQKKSAWDFIWFTNVSKWTLGGKSLVDTLKLNSSLNFHQRHVEFAQTSLHEIGDDIMPFLSKSLRTNIKQTQKHLSNYGKWDIKLSENIAELNIHMEALFSLHNKRWKKAGLKGSFERRPALVNFYKAFVPIALEKKYLRLLRLEINNEIQAIQLGYVYKNQFLAIQEGFNPDFLAGTGQVLRYFSFNNCLKEHLNDYDFLGGYTDHKRRWLAQKNIGCHLFIWQNKIKNWPFKIKKIWPTGRFLTEMNE